MTGSLQIKNGKYFAVLNFRDQHGKRVQKWFSLGLDVKGNKRRAETMLNELLVQYQGRTTTPSRSPMASTQTR